MNPDSPFSDANLASAAVADLLRNPPDDGRARLRLRVTFPDGSVRVTYARKTDTGHVAFGVAVTDLLAKPGVEVVGEWVFR